MDNDYTRCHDECQRAAADLEGIAGVDPDIEEKIAKAADLLRDAATLAEARA